MRQDYSFLEVCRDSVEEIGLAFVVTFLFLTLINRIEISMSLYEIAGKTIVETMIVAIGISVGTSQLGENKDKNSGTEDNQKNNDEQTDKEYFQLIVLSFCGAVLISSSVAPTDEILVIAVESSKFHLIFMVIVSLLLSWITLFNSDFRGSVKAAINIKKMFLHVITGYIVSLLIASGLLWFFNRFDGYGLYIVLAQIVVLGVPASLGASAGRLLLRAKK